MILENGTVLTKPSVQVVAEGIGLQSRSEVSVYDLIIVGSGPAGLASAFYGASEGLRTCVIERHAPGGQAGTSSRIENYLGFPSGISGDDLARRAVTQAKRFGSESLLAHEAVTIATTPGSSGITLTDGTEIRGHSTILATGVTYRKLDAPGADQLAGRGIYYGAARTEAMGFMGEDIYVVGGANSAGQAAIFIADIARSVTMLVRGSNLSAGMSHYLIERIEQTPNIHVRYNSSVVEATGDEHLESIRIRNTSTGSEETVMTPGLFVFIGARPSTEWLSDELLLDDRGFIVTGPDVLTNDRSRWQLDRDPLLLETSVPGIFAAGDVRHGSGKRVATAVGEGAMAVMSVWQYRSILGI